MAISDSFVPGITDGSAPTPPARFQTLSAAGSITNAGGSVFLEGTASFAASIESPPTGMDGARLDIINIGGYAHTVTYATTGFNSAGTDSDVATFAAAAGNALQLVAKDGVWYTLDRAPTGVTFG